MTAEENRWLRGILQLLGSWIIIGWVSALIDGIKILMAAKPAAASPQ